MAEASGLSLEKITCASDPDAIMIIARLEMAGNVNSCTSGAVWGKYTTDGKTLTVRNFDFPSFFRDLAKNYATIVVFKPNDGSNALAGVGFAGSITFGNMLNDKGIYTEANNGADSAGLVLFTNRWDVKKRESDDKTWIVQANQFKNPSWGIIALESPAAWFSSLREKNLTNLITAKTKASPLDLMKKIGPWAKEQR